MTSKINIPFFYLQKIINNSKKKSVILIFDLKIYDIMWNSVAFFLLN